MPQTTKQILTLLEDDSFPSMVILDGEWGVGKTHYIKSELIEALEKKEKKVIFFSLTGLSNINDFRDKLISCTYLSENVDQNLIGKLKDSAFSILNNTTDSGGTITSLIKGSTGAVKHAMLNRITDVTVILDDLERVDDPILTKTIIGECLQLIDEKKLEFIFVMNSTKANNIDNAMIEKSFSDHVYFQRPIQDAINIVFEKYNYFTDFQFLIKHEIKKLELTNIRVMKRAAKRLSQIYDRIIVDIDLDINASMVFIIKDVLRISYLHYCLGKNSNEIINGLDYMANFQSDEQKDEFKNYRTHNTPSNAIVEYCSGKTHLPPSIEQLGRLPKKGSLIDKLMFSKCYSLSEKEFNTLIEEFKKFIFEEIDVPISMWFEACDFYLYLLTQEFIEGDKATFIKNISKLCKVKRFDISDLNNRSFKLKISTPEILEKFNLQKEISKSDKITNDDTQRFERIKKSWVDIDSEIYKEFQFTNFINKYSEHDWLTAISNWQSNDIGMFANFLFDRYRSSNISNFLANEKNTLTALFGLLTHNVNQLPPSQKKGALKLLQSAIKNGIDKL